MNVGLRKLAEREGLSFEVARRTLSRLVVEAWAEHDRRENQKAAEAPETPRVEADVVPIGEQREKRAGRYRLTCESCRRRFHASRRHARFCSTACRVRAHRKRRAA